ncbi:hypothetical protein ACFQAT_26190 [Undibacterium arcticum]|uniref:hypothetical protein n=1 Tax=Undibacterium arcticum TaxID=1762892 RepID=UPI00361CE9FA
MKNIAGVLQGTVTPGQCHEIASLSPTERDRVINKLMGEATTGRFVVRGLDQQAKLFFFIPVVFTPNDRETSLIANFHGAKQVADALARSGLGQHQQSVRLIPKIFEHEEVAHWSTGDLQTMVHMIMTLDEDKIRRFPKRGSAADAHESTPILSYLVGAVFCRSPTRPVLDVTDWSYVSAVAANLLALQDGGSELQRLPTVLRPMEYKEALIEGTISSVQSTRGFLQSESVDEEGERGECDGGMQIGPTNFIFAPSGSPCIYLDGVKTTAVFQMDTHRLGTEGVQRVMERLHDVASCRTNKNACH